MDLQINLLVNNLNLNYFVIQNHLNPQSLIHNTLFVMQNHSKI